MNFLANRYHTQIKAFLIQNELLVIDFFTPNNKDWENSPFKKPPNYKFFFFSFNNRPIFEEKLEYLLISGENKQGYNEMYWLEIQSFIFLKNKFTFKKSLFLKNYKA